MKKTLVTFFVLTSVIAFSDQPTGGHGRATTIGQPVPGLTPQQLAFFAAGKTAYEREFTVADGLGPLFRGKSCAECHGSPVTGGQDPNGIANNVTHFMISNQGSFYLALEQGGPVLQHRSINSEPGGAGCPIMPETLPAMPGITTSQRHTPPVFGFGLLDAVPDKEILEWQGRQVWKDPSVIGVANWGLELEALVRLQAFTFDITRRQPAGIPRVGRFGWKSQTATLFQFTTEPFNIELGISTPYFPRENTPDGSPIPAACRLGPAQPNDTASKDSMKLFHFQALIGAPPTLPLTPRARYGAFIFRANGCADCHRPSLKTSNYFMPDQNGVIQKVDALSNKEIFPYSDLLTHDMGPGLQDGRVMGRAGPRFWRTTPLWGNRFKNRFMHDGRASSIDEAIDLHGGEAAHSVALYEALNDAQEEALLEFINSL